MTVQEAADKLEVSRALIYQLCRQGLLGHERYGVSRGRIRIMERDLAKFRMEAREKAVQLANESKSRAVDPYDGYQFKYINPRRG